MFYDLVYRASNYLEEKIIYRNATLHGIKVKQSAELLKFYRDVRTTRESVQ